MIQVCSLTTTFDFLRYTDKTHIGQTDIALSGGQKVRINLARAVYKIADIYLLDDPFSGVDIHVGQQIFDKCIKGTLGNKIVILVTQQLQYIKRADNIIILNEGTIQATGEYVLVFNFFFDFNFLISNTD